MHKWSWMFLPKHRSRWTLKTIKGKPICHPRRLKAIKKISIQIKYHMLNLFYTDGSNFSDLVGLCLSDPNFKWESFFPNLIVNIELSISYLWAICLSSWVWSHHLLWNPSGSILLFHLSSFFLGTVCFFMTLLWWHCNQIVHC